MKTRTPKKLHPDAVRGIAGYQWPGNVRELENILERAAILSADEYIHTKDLALPRNASSGAGQGKIGTAVSIRELEGEHIAGVLNHAGWDKNLAAKILGISLKTLYTKIQQYNISKK